MTTESFTKLKTAFSRELKSSDQSFEKCLQRAKLRSGLGALRLAEIDLLELKQLYLESGRKGGRAKKRIVKGN